MAKTLAQVFTGKKRVRPTLQRIRDLEAQLDALCGFAGRPTRAELDEAQKAHALARSRLEVLLVRVATAGRTLGLANMEQRSTESVIAEIEERAARAPESLKFARAVTQKLVAARSVVGMWLKRWEDGAPADGPLVRETERLLSSTAYPSGSVVTP